MKRLIAVCVVIVILVTAIFAYKEIGGKAIESKTYEHLLTKGYDREDVLDIEVLHSFVNKLLSYNEWRICVRFKAEPNVEFWYTYRNQEILRQGVSGTPLLDKDEMQEYDRKYDSGELAISFKEE